MRDGWPARDLLKPLWLAHGGRKAVALRAGVSEGHLSKVNAGKTNLGLDVATRFAEAVGVSLVELGGPADESVRSRTMVARLEALEADIVNLTTLVDALDARLKDLELAPARKPARSTRQEEHRG